MIMVRLMGGLGNQMFQYAAGRALADRLGSRLLLDTSYFDQQPATDTPRSYELQVYPVRAEVATAVDLSRVRRSAPGRRARLRAALRAVLPPWKPGLRWVGEQNLDSPAAFSDLPDNCYLDGYWQSEQYFAPIRAALLQEFRLPHPPTRVNREWLDRIGAQPHPVAVHVRRGDYVTNPHAAAFHGLCDADYYLEGAALLRQRHGPLHFFVFSDDPDWCRSSLQLPGTMDVVDANPPGQGWEDLRLMRSCRHFIIANSSFSWWGGWLGQAADKTVVAPRRWFLSGTVDTWCLIPNTWIRV